MSMRDEYNMPRTRTVYLDSDKIESLTQDGFQYFLRTISGDVYPIDEHLFEDLKSYMYRTRNRE